jgi:hypothetical protein
MNSCGGFTHLRAGTDLEVGTEAAVEPADVEDVVAAEVWLGTWPVTGAPASSAALG